MSALATFTRLPVSALEGLRRAAQRDPASIDDFVARHGTEVVAFEWSGWIFGTLLPYLEEKHQIDLMGEHTELAELLSKLREAMYVILTAAQRRRFLDRLAPARFSEAELAAYWQAFNGDDDPESGPPMLAGIVALRGALQAIDEGSVVLLAVG